MENVSGVSGRTLSDALFPDRLQGFASESELGFVLFFFLDALVGKEDGLKQRSQARGYRTKEGMARP